MATRLPPPKRVKVYHGVPQPEPEPVKPSPNIVVQFVSEDDGRVLAPVVNLPANTSREGMEAVLNRLSTQVMALSRIGLVIRILIIYIQDEDPVPFSFHVSLPEDLMKPGAPTRIVVSKSLEADVLAHSSGAFSQEDIIVVQCSPQSVFRVRPATRCSSTLSGS
jgi:ribosome assembly protein 4